MDTKTKHCCVEGCESTNTLTDVGRKGKIYCIRHASQIRSRGKIAERTWYDKNKIIDKGNYCEMEIYDSKGNVKALCLIDKEDVDKVKEHKWYLQKVGYVCHTIHKKGDIRIHRLILGLPQGNQGLDVDHRNGNKLDNRKSNLRIVTRSQNQMNKKGVKGYYFDNYYQRWKAEIKVDGKKIYLGSFMTELEAKNCRLEAERKYFGEYSYKLNNEVLA